MARVIIDAGHGGSDGGAVYNGRLEKDDNLRIALAVGELLEQNGLDVDFTRVTDVYDSPTEKARIANQSGADFFVSFHRNSSPTPNQYSGVETLVYDESGIKQTLAENINAGLANAGFANLGVEARPNLAVLRRTNMPAVLVEVGFINNDRDNALFDDNFTQITWEIANAIVKTLTGQELPMNDEFPGSGSTDAPTGTPSGTEDANGGERYKVQVGLFRNYQNASTQAYGLQNLGFPVEIAVNGPFFAVWVGDTDSLTEAIALEQQLQQLGYDTLLVTT